MRRGIGLLAALASVILCASSCRHSKEPVARIQTFESSDEGWIAYGTDAKVEVTHAPGDTKNGNGALALHYVYKPGQYGSAILPLERREVEHLGRLRLWIKTDHATAVAIVFSENQPGGGYYSFWFWSPKESWQHVELTPSDLSLNTGPTAPIDPDGRLDLDQVIAIGISDLGQAFQSMGVDPAYPLVVNRPTGAHTLWVDDLEFIPANQAAAPAGREHLIGDFSRGFLTWVTLGGAQLELSQSNPWNGSALKATYQQAEGRYVIVSHTLANLDLRGISTLNFKMAAANESRFAVYLEEKKQGSLEGPRYLLLLSIPGGGTAQEQSIALSRFTFDSTGPADADGRLDPAQLKSISFADITAAYTHNPQSNTLWLSAIAAQ